jgi:hypothetical protein
VGMTSLRGSPSESAESRLSRCAVASRVNGAVGEDVRQVLSSAGRGRSVSIANPARSQVRSGETVLDGFEALDQLVQFGGVG